MLQSQVINLDFGGGIETKQDSKLVTADKLLTLTNGIFSGTSAISRRPGYTPVSNAIIQGGTLSAPNNLAVLDKELLAITQQGSASCQLLALSESSAAWNTVGNICSFTQKTSTVNTVQTTTGEAYSNPIRFAMDSATNGAGITCYAYCVTAQGITAVYYSIYDETTQAVIVTGIADPHANTSSMVSVNYFNGQFYVFSAAAQMRCMKISATTYLTSTFLNVAPLFNTGPGTTSDTAKWCSRIFNGNIWVLYNAGQSTPLRIIGLNPISLAVSATLDTGPATTDSYIQSFSLTACASGNSVIATCTGINTGSTLTSIYFAAINTFAFTVAGTSSTTLAASVGTPYSITGASISNSAQLFFSWGIPGVQSVFGAPPSGLNLQGIKTLTCSSICVLSAITDFKLGNYRLASDAFVTAFAIYVNVINCDVYGATPLFQGIYTLDNTARVVAKIATGNTVAALVQSQLPQVNVPDLSNPSFAFAVYGRQLAGRSSLNFGPYAPGSATQILLSKATLFPNRNRYAQWADIGGAIFFAGAAPQLYDGNSVSEVGFNYSPQNFSYSPTTTVPAAGQGLGVGTYQYCQIFEWVDATGRRHQSAPSPATTYVNPGPGNVEPTLYFEALTATDKGLNGSSPAYVVLFRTLVNGTTFYRITPPGPILNTYLGSYLDIDNDTTIAANEILYTTGGVLPSIAPPACTLVKRHVNRLFLAGLVDPNLIWYSEQFQQFNGIVFNDTSLTMRIPRTGGDITAMESMDDKLIVFEETDIYVVYGTGPNNLGLQNNFSDPQHVVSDVGCIEPRSVVKTPRGIIFQSKKGIYLLDRTLQLSFIGSPVDAFVRYVPGQSLITSAVLSEVNQAVYFSLNGVQNLVLNYNYLYNQWSTFTFVPGDALIWKGQLTFVSIFDGFVHQITPTQYSDNGAVIPLTIETAWIKPSGVQGFQRARRLLLMGASTSQSTVAISTAYNYLPTYATSTSFDTTSAGIASGGMLQVREHIARQKCEAIRFKIIDTPAYPASGLGLTSLALELGVKKGAFKLPVTNTIA